MRVVVLAALLPTLSGCNIAYYAGHNLVNDPILEANRIKLRHRLRGDARDAWREECKRQPQADLSAAYKDGFLDGFVDYLDDGGPGLPPVAPPTRYRRHADDFTAEGQQAERDYLTGFQRGAEVAAASGCREKLLVHMALPGPKPELPLSITCIPASRPTPGRPADPPPTPTPPPPPTQPEVGPQVTPPAGPGPPPAAPPTAGPRVTPPPVTPLSGLAHR